MGMGSPSRVCQQMERYAMNVNLSLHSLSTRPSAYHIASCVFNSFINSRFSDGAIPFNAIGRETAKQKGFYSESDSLEWALDSCDWSLPRLSYSSLYTQCFGIAWTLYVAVLNSVHFRHRSNYAVMRWYAAGERCNETLQIHDSLHIHKYYTVRYATKLAWGNIRFIMQTHEWEYAGDEANMIVYVKTIMGFMLYTVSLQNNM